MIPTSSGPVVAQAAAKMMAAGLLTADAHSPQPTDSKEPSPSYR